LKIEDRGSNIAIIAILDPLSSILPINQTVLLKPLKSWRAARAKMANVITKTLAKLSTVRRTIDGFIAEAQ